jgi:transposase
MSKAIKAAIDGTSIRQASEEYSVPRSTLHDRITGKVKPGSKSGPKSYLSSLEEQELVSF